MGHQRSFFSRVHPVVLVAVAGIGISACGSSRAIDAASGGAGGAGGVSSADGGQAGTGGSGGWSGSGMCRWPAELDGNTPGQCVAARADVECTFPSGASCRCISNDPAICTACVDGGVTIVEDGGMTCQNRCGPGEYAVACGQVGPGPIPDRPAGCGRPEAIPAGIIYYCCPCL